MEQALPFFLIAVVVIAPVVAWLIYRRRKGDDGVQIVYNYSSRKWLAAELEERRLRDMRKPAPPAFIPPPPMLSANSGHSAGSSGGSSCMGGSCGC